MGKREWATDESSLPQDGLNLFTEAAPRSQFAAVLQDDQIFAVKQGTEFKVQGHWGPLEHLTAAEGLLGELKSKGLVPNGQRVGMEPTDTKSR